MLQLFRLFTFAVHFMIIERKPIDVPAGSISKKVIASNGPRKYLLYNPCPKVLCTRLMLKTEALPVSNPHECPTCASCSIVQTNILT